MALGQLYDDTTGNAYNFDPTSNPSSAPGATPPAPPSSEDTFDPTKASPTTGIGGNGGAGQAQYPSTTPSSSGSSNYGPMEGVDSGKLRDPSVTSPKYIAARILASGGTLAQAAAAIGATVLDGTRMRLRTGEVIDTRRDSEGVNALQWLVDGGGGPSLDASGGSAGGPANPFPTAQTGSQFDDPVTKEWETMLRQLVDKLNTPQPMWSNSQLDLMQTQATDPLERQRQAEKQQMTQTLAARGMVPGSGPFIAAMQDIDRRFDQLRTQTQAGFATNAVGREDQLFNSNEQRNVNAVNMFKQIPQYADTRLQLAMNALTPSNPYQLMQLQQQYQQQGQQAAQYQNSQDQAYWMNFFQSLIPLFTT